jgi:Sec-independent protein secretion pathway component TatC
MSVAMFIIGAIIFSFYVYFLIWNIFYSTKKQREENRYPTQNDPVDLDGMGNFSRFPENK